MRFLVDANLPRSVIELLTNNGHQAEFSRDIGLAAVPDSFIATRALQNKAALLTRDLDFADIRQYPPRDYYGIVVIRAPDDFVATDIVRILERFIRQPNFMAQLVRRLAIVEPDRVRFRPALGLQ
jgi:predicted nuclease of predicted toxin-antitoxin system